MTNAHASAAPLTPGIHHVAVAELPTTFDTTMEWVEALLEDHPVGFRAFVDLSQLDSKTPPRIAYIEAFLAALQPVIAAGGHVRCALIVPAAWMRKARLMETMTRGSRLQLRAFENAQQSLAWL